MARRVRWAHAIPALLLSLSVQACAQRAEPPQEARERMVKQQIEERGVKDRRVLEAMRRVPRHLFVPPPLVPHAYDDTPLPTASGQTISQPYIVAFMTEQLRPEKSHVALEVGTGSGYQAAVLSLLVSKVYTIELLPELARTAAERLQKLGYRNVEVKQGDGYAGWPDHAPYDLIIVTAAPLEVPPALVQQLKPGGRLIIPVGPAGFQELQLATKDESGRLQVRSVLPVAFVPLIKPGK
jgi:protein-L-isoaspartate(D-aspartate) O-methyltransferase